jgi:uncharacterized protein YndB with AHSA1/START domain
MTTITKNNHVSITTEPGNKEILIVKEFDAERDLVFKAFTDPYLYSQWIGPKGLTMKIDRFEPRNGGSYRFVQKDGQGKEFAFHGVYHEVLFPERLITTMEFEGNPEKGHVELDTAKFETLPGSRTKLTIQAVFQSVEDRDGIINNGMEKGIDEGFERLDEILSRNLTSWDI